MNLSRMPKPVNDANSCGLDQLADATRDVPYDDLFKRKRMKGWWPSYEVNDEGVRELNVSKITILNWVGQSVEYWSVRWF